MRVLQALRSPFLLAALLLLVPARPAAQRDGAFMQEFRKLMQVHDAEGMAALVKKHEQEAELTVREIVQLIGDGSNEILETEIDALGKAWRKAYDSQFVSLQYDLFAIRLTGPYKRQHKERTTRYNLKHKEFTAAEAAKDVNALPALGLEFQSLGDNFGELGDPYLASHCYRIYAVCFDDGLSGTKADYKRACEGWGLYLKAREAAQLKGKAYDEAKVRYEKLEYDGYGDPTKGPEARAAAKAASDTSYQPAPLNAVFQLVPDIEAIQRPLYTADSNFQIWSAVMLKGNDSSGVFPTMENSPAVLRTGANKASVDVNGDGTGDVDIPLTGKIAPIEITLGSGDAERKWGFLAVIGQQQDTYQGFRFNLGPDENQMSIYVAPAGSLAGTVNGLRVRVLDDNMDGFYGSAPKDWAYPGLIDGVYQHDVDSVVIGESKLARPWSRLQKVGDAWYELAPDPGGKDLIATRTDVETGTLQLDLKGAPVTWLLVRGTGNNQDLFFDVANGGTNKVEVPIGSYELYSGQVAEGKKAQVAKALVMPGPNSRSWRVNPGETTKIELGAPFGFAFTVRQDENTVTVEGPSIVVTGRGGETYQRLWNCVLSPEVNLRKAGSSKGKKEKKLVPVGSQEDLEVQKYDFRTAWFPISEPIDKPQPGETFEVQLFEKKNKLFGKVESAWKAD